MCRAKGGEEETVTVTEGNFCYLGSILQIESMTVLAKPFISVTA
jgi:hypothetical protein